MIILDNVTLLTHITQVKNAADAYGSISPKEIPSPSDTLLAATMYGQQEKELQKLIWEYLELLYTDLGRLKKTGREISDQERRIAEMIDHLGQIQNSSK